MTHVTEPSEEPGSGQGAEDRGIGETFRPEPLLGFLQEMKGREG